MLDNFEQVAGGRGAGGLLTACPDLVILVTSRALLHLAASNASRCPAGAAGARHGGDAASGELRDRRRRVGGGAALRRARPGGRPGLRADADNAAAIAAICRRLDGLPLAIELAAARIAHALPSELLARLDAALPLLTDGPRDAPHRLRTMRAGHRLELRPARPDEQAALPPPGRLRRRLHARGGGGGCGCRQANRRRAPTSIASLVDKSLLQQEREPGRDEPRYAMLETMREFGLEQLAASGEEAATREAHAAHYLALAEAAATRRGRRR